MVKGRYIGDGHPLIGNPYNGYINPYYWVDDHPLFLYGNNGSLDPGTYANGSRTNSQGLLRFAKDHPRNVKTYLSGNKIFLGKFNL